MHTSYVVAALALCLPTTAWAGATVWVPNGATSAKADGPGEPIGPDSPNKYPPWNAIDGDPKTTFVVVKGEALRVRLGGTPKIHHVELVAGYAKNDKVWQQNRRPTKVRVRTKLKSETRPWKTVTYDPPETLPKNVPWWSISLEPAVAADTIEIEVLDSEAGKKNRYEDICLSEIVLLTSENQPTPKDTYRFDVPLSDDRDAMPFERFRLDGDTCKDLEHDNTGGALSVFVGECRVKKSKMSLDGVLEIREPDDVEKQPMKKRFSFRRVNRRLVLVGGFFYSR